MGQEYFKFRWEIKRQTVENLFATNINLVDSETFSLAVTEEGSGPKSDWYFRLQVVKNEPPPKHLKLSLISKWGNPRRLMIRFGVTVKAIVGKPGKRVSQPGFTRGSSKLKSFPNLVSKPELDTGDFWINESLILKCDGEIQSADPVNVSTLVPIVNHPMLAPTLPQDYEELLKNGCFSDFTLLVGEQKFHVHRCILSVRSTYFEAMFNAGMVESSAKEMKIDGVTPEIFYILLQYLYSGRLIDPCPEDVVVQVLKAADRYSIVPLVSLCEYRLASYIHATNFADLLELTDTYPVLDFLKRSVMTFVRSIDAHNEAFDTAAWKSLQLRKAHVALLVYREQLLSREESE